MLTTDLEQLIMYTRDALLSCDAGFQTTSAAAAAVPVASSHLVVIRYAGGGGGFFTPQFSAD